MSRRQTHLVQAESDAIAGIWQNGVSAPTSRDETTTNRTDCDSAQPILLGQVLRTPGADRAPVKRDWERDERTPGPCTTPARWSSLKANPIESATDGGHPLFKPGHRTIVLPLGRDDARSVYHCNCRNTSGSFRRDFSFLHDSLQIAPFLRIYSIQLRDSGRSLDLSSRVLTGASERFSATHRPAVVRCNHRLRLNFCLSITFQCAGTLPGSSILAGH